MTDQSAEQALLQHQFPLLDSMRAIGAMAVLTTHVAFWSGTYTGNGVWGTLLARLDVGVAIFFVLSGFLLARPHLVRASIGSRPPGVGRYYWKRALRILPLYWLAAVLALALITKNNDLGVRDWLVTLTLGNTFVDNTLPNGLTHMWSLAVEVTFYLVLPLLMLAGVGRSRTLSPGRVSALVAVMFAVTIAWELVGSPFVGQQIGGQPNQWLPAYLGWFGIGIFLALVDLLHRNGDWPRLTRRAVLLAQQPGSCWAMIAGLMLVVSTPLAGPSMLVASTPGQLLAKNAVYGMVGGLLVLTAVFAKEGSLYSRLFSHRAARHLGFISYGLFCLHLPVLHTIMWATGWELFEGRFWAIWVLATICSLIAAELAYRVVEAPAMRLKDLGRSRAAITTDAVTAASTR